LHRLADQRVGGEVEYCVDAMLKKKPGDGRSIRKVSDDEQGLGGNRLAVALGEVVEDDYAVTARQEF
jgi:hypothetical protein